MEICPGADGAETSFLMQGWCPVCPDFAKFAITLAPTLRDSTTLHQSFGRMLCYQEALLCMHVPNVFKHVCWSFAGRAL